MEKNKNCNIIKILLLLIVVFLLLYCFGDFFRYIKVNRTIMKDNIIQNNKKMDYKVYNNKNKYNSIVISKKDKSRVLYKKINKAKSVCFIGDSISAGSRNGGYGWFLPLINAFDEKRVINISKGGATVKSITNIYNKEKCDLYIIEIGTNDVRYRDSSKCAMDEVEYIEDLKLLVDKIPNNNEKDFVFIAPWLSLDNDPWIRDVKEKNKLLTKYRKSLKKFCLENNYLYIDPNSRIEDAFKKNSPSKYLVDHIHPNSKEGIYLYSRAVMDASS